MSTTDEAIGHVEVVAYNPAWPAIFEAERTHLQSNVVPPFLDLEHIGSTAVLGQRAKPIIDMLAAVESLTISSLLVDQLAALNYRLVETDMKGRLLFRKPASEAHPSFHLHIVEWRTWNDRKERLMRDYLRKHPDTVLSYGRLKDRLATTFAENSLAYTRAKTDFLQEIMDRACDERGIPRIDVWKDD